MISKDILNQSVANVVLINAVHSKVPIISLYVSGVDYFYSQCLKWLSNSTFEDLLYSALESRSHLVNDVYLVYSTLLDKVFPKFKELPAILTYIESLSDSLSYQEQKDSVRVYVDSLVYEASYVEARLSLFSELK